MSDTPASNDPTATETAETPAAEGRPATLAELTREFQLFRLQAEGVQRGRRGDRHVVRRADRRAGDVFK